ncbi:hypothetical protein ADIAL_2103 [Alkalibacterium sp. AK22]|uniref:hypothetical protein n=1 Tax=Alkalibacterium sp. AK22 TaxID=1229520 RepID=UPI00044D6651|nr:hypothetical protein [Alkalibacterium sp. AK22]EXJ22517.1 hypothetical protein ADIAL_2103 [Alkalibacterium sp. AK22]
MDNSSVLQVEVKSYQSLADSDFNLYQAIFDIENEISLLSNQPDTNDYLVSIGSGILSGLLDTLWVGKFNLERGRAIAAEEVDRFVVKTAKLLGSKSNDLESSVRFLENKFPIPSDGNTADLGGSLQHHLRDFGHHPTIVGLMFSLLTQFTYKSYGTDTIGQFKVVDVPERSKVYIGDDVPSKIFKGTIIWFFHLVSDMAGSSNTVGKSGGTGIPGPLLSLAKELSALPIFKEMTVKDHSLSVFLSKLFNGTLLAKRDQHGNIIKGEELRFDLRAEMGLGIEVSRQALPVIANECMVRSFYFIRRLGLELQKYPIHSESNLKQIRWENVKPINNPTLSRMLTISTGVFTSIDISEAFISQKNWIAVNYVGIGRFMVAVGSEISWGLSKRNLLNIREMYKVIESNTYLELDNNINKRVGEDMVEDSFGLTLEQTEILYNLEYYKTLNDIRTTKTPRKSGDIKVLKHLWLVEWKEIMSKNFAGFVNIQDSELRWFTEEELKEVIETNQPTNRWFKLVLLETMLFEPYYTLELEEDNKGKTKPDNKYKSIQNKLNGYNKKAGDHFINSFFVESYYPQNYIFRLRKTYNKIINELSETLKTAILSLSVTSLITILTLVTAGAFAPAIAVTLVGSKFAGLSGAALTAASLAYLGGGAVAAGGAGMAGGTIAIVGGGALLGAGVGTGIGGAVGVFGLLGKKNTIKQSAKLLVSIREIFLNDEHDLAYSNTVYEQYVNKIMVIEKGIIELNMRVSELSGQEKKQLQRKIKNAEESVKAMKIAKNSMRKFISSFEVGKDYE